MLVPFRTVSPWVGAAEVLLILQIEDQKHHSPAWTQAGKVRSSGLPSDFQGHCFLSIMELGSVQILRSGIISDYNNPPLSLSLCLPPTPHIPSFFLSSSAAGLKPSLTSTCNCLPRTRWPSASGLQPHKLLPELRCFPESLSS